MTRAAPDELLLAAIHLQGERPLTEIARRLKRPEHQVRYAIQRLESEGIVRRHPFIDVYPLGFSQFEIYLSLAAQSAKAAGKFLSALQASPFVPWIGEFAGEFQYAFTLCLRNPFELQTLLDGFSASFGGVVFRKAVAIRISYTEFHLKRFSSAPLGPEELTFGGTLGAEVIDETDHRLLSLMSRNEGMAISAISDKLNVPVPTLHARLRRLKEKKIYRGDCCIIDFAKLGYSTFKLLVSVKQAGPKLRREIFSFAAKHKSVQYFVHCIGNWDFELGILLPKADEINDLVQQLYDQFSNDVVSVQTLTAFSYPKVIRYPFEKLP